MGDILDYFKQKKNLTSLLLLGIFILGLPIGIQLLKQRQIIKSRAQADPIDFTGGANVEKRGSEWVVLDPRNQITFSLTSPLGPAGPTSTPTPSPTPVGSATPAPTSTPAPAAPTATPIPTSESITINLNAGWNLISFPRPLTDSSVSSVFTGYVDKVYYFDARNDAWVLAKLENGRWVGTLTNIQAGKAYWVNALAGVNSLIAKVVRKDTGRSIVNPPFADNNWNMIGFSTQSDEGMTVVSYLTSIGIKDWETVYKIENGVWKIAKPDGSGTFTEVKVGEGYWVNVKAGRNTPPDAPK